MSEDKNNDFERSDVWLWENQCLEELDSESDYENKLREEKELTYHKLWHLFQGAATCVAHLHKGSQVGSDRSIRWTPFQTAAGSLTALYKESVDGVRRCSELAVLHGRQLRNRELAAWLRRRRATAVVRREELLAFLTGRAAPLTPLPPATSTNSAAGGPRSSHRVCSYSSSAVAASFAGSGGLGVAGGGGVRSTCRRLLSNSLPNDSVSDQPPHLVSSSSTNDTFLLNSAVSCANTQQLSSPTRAAIAIHHRRAPSSLHHSPTPVKRPATPSSPADVTMDSPTHKRPRPF